jgi:virulence-associated protein VagC
VRLPKEFRFPGTEVRISRTKSGGVLLMPERKGECANEKKADAVRTAIRRITSGTWDVDLPPDPPPSDENIGWPRSR